MKKSHKQRVNDSDRKWFDFVVSAIQDNKDNCITDYGYKKSVNKQFFMKRFNVPARSLLKAFHRLNLMGCLSQERYVGKSCNCCWHQTEFVLIGKLGDSK